MSARSYMEGTGKQFFCVFVSFLIVALFLLNSIPMEFIQKKSWEHTDLTSGTEEEGSSRLPDHIFRGEGSEVRIIEIMFNPVGDDRGREWIAIYNNGTDEQSLDGWGISNSDGEIDAQLPDWNLPGASTLYVHFGIGDDENDFEDYIGHYHTQNPYEIFNNSADGVALFKADTSNGSIIDYMAWEDATVVNYTGGSAGSLAQHAGLWREADFITSSTFEEGIALGRTRIDPTLDSSGDWELGRMVINEVLFKDNTNASESDFGEEHVELRNPTDATVSLNGWTLDVDGGGMYGMGSFDLPPKSFAVIHFVRDDLENDTDMKDGCANIHYTVSAGVLGDSNGGLGLYSPRGIEDYIAWGTGGTGDVTTDAVGAGIWSSGTAVTGSFSEGDSIGRDQFSTDSDGIADWSLGGGPFSNGPTIGTLNYYNLMIWDADLWADPGEEWIKLSNYGGDVNVEGWKIYNRDGVAVATLPDITFLEDSTLTIYFGVGTDDLDFSDNDGSWYVSGSQGDGPSSKLFNESLDIILITTGELDGESTVTFEIWLEDGFNNRGTRGWFSDAWNAVKDAGKWVADKVEQAVNVVVDGVLKAAKWLKEKIAQAQAWVLSKIKDGLSFDISLGEYLTLTLTTLAMGWKFHAEANVEFDIPVPGFPILQLHFAAQGSITIVKGCGGLTSSGQIVLTVGVNVGANIKKLFTLELRAHLRLTITVGNLDIDDFCNPETHQGTVTVGLDIALDLVLGATFKLNTPEYELFDNDWDWNLAQFTWSQTKDYECCRDPKPKPGPKPGPFPVPPDESCPPYYGDTYTSASAYFHVTNTDLDTHIYQWGASSNTPGWLPTVSPDSNDMYLIEQGVPSGYTVGFYGSLKGPPSWMLPHTFSPSVTSYSGDGGGGYLQTRNGNPPEPLQYSGDKYYGAPGEKVSMYFSVVNLVEEISLVDISLWISATENETLNSTLNMVLPIEKIDITAVTENEWDTEVANEDGVMIQEDMQQPGLFDICNFEGERYFMVLVEIPENAEIGSVENVTFGMNSALPNSTEAHMANISAKIRVGEKVEEAIWSDDLENEQEADMWDNSTGLWEWGLPRGDYIEYEVGPYEYHYGPHIWGTNLSGKIERNASYILKTRSFDLSAYDHARIGFWHWIQGSDLWNGEISLYVNSSGTWNLVDSFDSENPSYWKQESYDISMYISDEVQFIFYLQLGKYINVNAYGWHIDDISLTGVSMASMVWNDELENDTSAAQDYDNSTGEWEWGAMPDIDGGPQTEPTGPNVWATVLNGTTQDDVESVLLSKAFDLSGYDIVNLRLVHWIQAKGTMKLYINSSGVWSLAANWSGETDWSDWIYEVIDISEFISNSVQLVFYYNSSYNSQPENFGWHITRMALVTWGTGDLVLTDVTPLAEGDTLPPGSEEITVNVKNQGDITYTDIPVGLLPTYTGGDTIFSDDFETDKGWNTGNSAWNRDDDLNFGTDLGYSMNIGGATEVRASRGGSNTEELISPVIDLSDTEEPVLGFRVNTWFEGDGIYRCELYLSNNSGQNWSAVPVWGKADNSHGTWEYVEIPLELYATANFTMKFVLVTYTGKDAPFMVLDEISISARNDNMLEYVVGSIASLEPGEETNVTLNLDLAEVGPYELLFFVNCSSDSDMANNYLEIPIFVNQLAAPEISDLAPGDNISGMVNLRMEYDDAESNAARFYYGPASRGDNLTLIGETSSPDSNMVWSVSWDTHEVANGDYVLTGEMVDIWGGKVSVSVGVTVWNPMGSIEANFTHQEIEGMPGTFMFTDISEPHPASLEIIAYYWDFGDGAASCLESPVHTYENDGTYFFYHSVTGAHGEIYAVQAPVVVIGTQVIPEVSANFTISPENEITRLTNVQFNDTSIAPPEVNLNRKWNFGDGNISTDASPVHKYSRLGQYTVNLSLTDKWGNRWTHLKHQTVQNILPKASFTMNPRAANVNKNINFTATGEDDDGNITSWEWSFGDGETSVGKTVTHSYKVSSNYTIELKVTDNDGGVFKISKNVFIFKEDTTVIDIIEVRMGEIRHLTYEDPSGSFINVTISGDGTLVAAKVNENSEDVSENPPNVRISFFLRLKFDGVMNWTNITISYAEMPINESLNYSKAQIFYNNGIQWEKAKNTGVIEEKKIVWANVTHFTIFAAYALPSEGEEPEEGGGAGGEEDKEAWYKSSGFIITGVVILVIIVMVGVFIYARGQKGEEDEDEEEEEEDEKKDEVEEAEEVIKDIKEKDEEEEEDKEDEEEEEEEEEEDKEEAEEEEPEGVDESDEGDVPKAPEADGDMVEEPTEDDDEEVDLDDIQPVPDEPDDELEDK